MKLRSKIIFFLLGCIVPNHLLAQEYAFQYYQAPYQSLTNAVVISDVNDPCL